MRPLAIDLFCGLGGWADGFLAEGWRVVGFDNDPRFAKVYPGEFVLADVRTLDGRRFRRARAIVASPPCNKFSQMLRLGPVDRTPKVIDMSLVEAAFRIRRESGVPTVIENVRDARRYFPEPARCHRGPFWLWGDVPLLSPVKVKPKIGGSFHKGRPSYRSRGWADRDRSKMGAALRAKIPKELARAIARGFL